jgi:hypothetical protein
MDFSLYLTAFVEIRYSAIWCCWNTNIHCFIKCILCLTEMPFMNRNVRYSHIWGILQIKIFQTVYYSTSVGDSQNIDSWLSEMTSYLLGGRGLFPSRCTDFLLRHHVMVDSGASCLASSWRLFTWLKWAVAWSWTFTSTCSVEVRTAFTFRALCVRTWRIYNSHGR